MSEYSCKCYCSHFQTDCNDIRNDDWIEESNQKSCLPGDLNCQEVPTTVCKSGSENCIGNQIQSDAQGAFLKPKLKKVKVWKKVTKTNSQSTLKPWKQKIEDIIWKSHITTTEPTPAFYKEIMTSSPIWKLEPQTPEIWMECKIIKSIITLIF